jgi:hypothetical protein
MDVKLTKKTYFNATQESQTFFLSGLFKDCTLGLHFIIKPRMGEMVLPLVPLD